MTKTLNFFSENCLFKKFSNHSELLHYFFFTVFEFSLDCKWLQSFRQIVEINKSDESPSESSQNVTNTRPKESPVKLFSKIPGPKVETLSTISENLETDTEWTDLKGMLGHNCLIFPVQKTTIFFRICP